MTDQRTFIAHAHTLSGEVLSLTLSTIDGQFPAIIQGTAFPDHQSETDTTFFLGTHQDAAGESAEYYLESEDPAAAEPEHPGLLQRLRDRVTR